MMASTRRPLIAAKEVCHLIRPSYLLISVAVPDNLAADMNAAVWSGVYADSTPTGGLFTCPSGNCTYPPTPSLGVCSQCHNLTSKLTYNYGTWGFLPPDWNGTYDPSLPTTPYLGGSDALQVQATNVSSRTISFQDQDGLFASFVYLNRTNLDGGSGEDNKPQSWECALWMCVKVYEASVISGVLNERVTQIFNKMAPHVGLNAIGGDEDFQIMTRPSLIPSPPAKQSFNISALAFHALRLKVPWIFPGSVSTASYGPSDGDALSTFDNSDSDIMQHFFTISDPVAMVRNMEASMTSSIRRNPDIAAQSAADYIGTAYLNIPRVQIVWPWITLPAALVLFSNVFLIYVIYKTQRMRDATSVGVWKSSQIPLLYHGLDQATRQQSDRELGPAPRISQMERHATKLSVRLQETGSGKLMLGM
jgi:hypothetical protein